MIDLNSKNMEWIFSGVGATIIATIITTIVALYIHRKRQRIDVTINKSALTLTNFKEIELSDKSMKLDDHFFPFSSIRNISLETKDLRTDSQKKRDKEGDSIGGLILIGVLLIIAFLGSIASIFYTGVEYGLSTIGIEGLFTDIEQSVYFSNAITLLVLTFMAIVSMFLALNLGGSDRPQKWEWILRIAISDETTYLIKSNSKKIEYLKSAIEQRMNDDINEDGLSFMFHDGGVHEKRLVTALKNNYTGYSSVRPHSTNVLDKEVIGNWSINGDGTVSDHANGLMWIQAPWGMSWNGNTFTGRSIEISWADAKKLFGKGKFSGKTEYGRLSKEELHGIRYENEFVRGECRVEFSGLNDWRLATADDWSTIQFMSDRFCYPDMKHDDRKEHIEKLFPQLNAYQKHWTSTGKWHPYMCEKEDISKLSGIRKLFAKMEITMSKFHQAFDLKKYKDSGYTAWVCDFRNNLDEGGHIEYPLMFVRKL